MGQLGVDLRPRSFSEVIGHSGVIKTLTAKIKKGEQLSALMFIGPPGTGKTTLAKIVAREIQGSDFPGDDKPDTYELNCASVNGVDAMRVVEDLAMHYPIGGKFRVIILDEAQRLTKEAQTILLKPFEAQGSKTVFIICTTDPQDIGPAIRTRCLTFHLSGMNSQERDQLLVRAAKSVQHEGDLVEFSKELTRRQLTSPRAILNAFDNYHNGMSATDAVAGQADDGTETTEPETAEATENKESEVAEEPLPEFPRLTGPLGHFVDAITDDIPYAHRALAALTYVGLALSRKVELTGGDYGLQPRFYACLVGPPNTGKSRARVQVCQALEGVAGVHVVTSIDSNAGLFETLVNHRRLLYSPDQLEKAMLKAKTDKSIEAWLQLYENNNIERRVVKRNGGPKRLNDVDFALLGSTTPEDFSYMWQGTRGASGGLQSRFVLSFSDKPWPQDPTPTDPVALLQAVEDLTKALTVAPSLVGTKWTDVWGLTPWEGIFLVNEKLFPRVITMSKRFALVLAACNGETSVSDETLWLVEKFAHYQVALRERLMPPDSTSPTQTFEHSIKRYFDKRPQTTKDCARNWIKPDRRPGGFGAFNRAFNSLVQSGELKIVGKNRKENPLYKLAT